MGWNPEPPNKRSNWHKMNEGNRRYAMEQYNLARVRRGLPVDHPIPGNEGPSDTDNLDDILSRPREGEAGLADALDREISGAQGQENLERQAIEDFDEGLFESTDQGDRDQHSGAMADSTVGNVSHEQPGPAPKRQRTQGGGHKLPGTAKGQAGGEGIGGGSRSGQIVHPSRSIHMHTRFYQKVHRFFSFGLAYKPIYELANERIFMSTPLLHVPVEWLYLYMNPSEYAQLPLGAKAIKCRVKVTQRNVRVAFPTNATTSNLATLNQNKNIVYSIGLNKKIDGRNSKYTTFNATQPMIPEGVAKITDADHLAVQTEMYSSAANLINTMPRHQFGQPQAFNDYYTPIYWTGGDEDGWQSFQSAVVEMDGDSTAGQELVEYNYDFAVGLIKPPKKALTRAFNTPNTIPIPRSSHNFDAHIQTVTINATTQPTNSTSSVSATTPVLPTTAAAYLTTTIQPIEKSQWLHEGIMTRPHIKCQDSLHIGVQPTYALTTTNISTTNNSFTDTQAYFELECELEVDTNYSTFRTLTNESNTYVNNLWTSNATIPDYHGQLIDGLLQNQTV